MKAAKDRFSYAFAQCDKLKIYYQGNPDTDPSDPMNSFDEYFPYLADEPYVHYYDSLTFEVDSSKTYRLVAIERADTLYDRLEMIIQSDTLSVCDTVPVCDKIPEEQPVVKSEPVKSKVDNVKGRAPQRAIQGPITKGKVIENKDLNSNMQLWQQSR